MKKTLSLILSILLMISAISAPAFAFAQSTEWLPRENPQDVLTFVNGEENYDIYTEADSKSGGIKITYKGDGVVTEWEFPLSQNGKDYKPVSQGKNSITIVLLNQDKVLPYVTQLYQEVCHQPFTVQLKRLPFQRERQKPIIQAHRQ